MGPFAVEIADEKLPLLKKALKELGLHLDGE
jgi:hypothetical protein